MKNFYLIMLPLFFAPTLLSGQTDSNSLTDNYMPEKDFRDRIETYANNPVYWNRVLEFLENYISGKDTTYGKWLNELNLEFKTFQNQDSTRSSLGLSYDFKLERAKIREKGALRNGIGLALESKGNIAFNKEVNPYDFLNSKIVLNLFRLGGGVTVKETDKDLSYYAGLRRKLAVYNSADEILASPEWKEMNDKFVLSNSWIIKYDLNAGIESNQDFTQKQYTGGIRFGAGLKSWDKTNLTSKLNIIDYPFELIRRITGYNGNIHTGITIPSLLVGLDYVNPENDAERETIEGELKPFPRVNLELGFRTVLTEVSGQTLYFNSSYKYYKELSVSQSIKDNNYDDFAYFTASLTSSNGLYVSYSQGKLPFDRQSDAVYEIGFKYKLE